jgi:hypothetical protein
MLSAVMVVTVAGGCGQETQEAADTPSEKDLTWVKVKDSGLSPSGDHLDPARQFSDVVANEGMFLTAERKRGRYFWAGDLTSSFGWGAEWYRDLGDFSYIYVVECDGKLQAFSWAGQKDKCDARQRVSAQFTRNASGAYESASLEIRSFAELSSVASYFAFSNSAPRHVDWLFRNSALGESIRNENWLFSPRRGNFFVANESVYAWRNNRPWQVLRLNIVSTDRHEKFPGSNYRYYRLLTGGSVADFQDDGGAIQIANVEVSHVSGRFGVSEQVYLIEGKNLDKINMFAGGFQRSARPVWSDGDMSVPYPLTYTGYLYQIVDTLGNVVWRNIDTSHSLSEAILDHNAKGIYRVCYRELGSATVIKRAMGEVPVARISAAYGDNVQCYGFYLPQAKPGDFLQLLGPTWGDSSKTKVYVNVKIRSASPQSSQPVVPVGFRLGTSGNRIGIDFTFNGQSPAFQSAPVVRVEGKLCEFRVSKITEGVNYWGSEMSSCMVSDDETVKRLIARVASSPNHVANVDVEVDGAIVRVPLPKSHIALDHYHLLDATYNIKVGIPDMLLQGWGFQRHTNRKDSMSAIRGFSQDLWLFTSVGWVVSNEMGTSLYTSDGQYLPDISRFNAVKEYVKAVLAKGQTLAFPAVSEFQFVVSCTGQGFEFRNCLWDTSGDPGQLLITGSGVNMNTIDKIEVLERSTQKYVPCGAPKRTVTEEFLGRAFRVPANSVVGNDYVTCAIQRNPADVAAGRLDDFLRLRLGLKNGKQLAFVARNVELNKDHPTFLVKDPALAGYSFVSNVPEGGTVSLMLDGKPCYPFTPSASGVLSTNPMIYSPHVRASNWTTVPKYPLMGNYITNCVAKTPPAGAQLLEARFGDLVAYRNVVDGLAKAPDSVAISAIGLRTTHSFRAKYNDFTAVSGYTFMPLNHHVIGVREISVKSENCPIHGQVPIKISEPGSDIPPFIVGGTCDISKMPEFSFTIPKGTKYTDGEPRGESGAPILGAYDQADFQITFADQTSVSGRASIPLHFGFPGPEDAKTGIAYVPATGPMFWMNYRLGPPPYAESSAFAKSKFWFTTSCEQTCSASNLRFDPADETESSCLAMFNEIINKSWQVEYNAQPLPNLLASHPAWLSQPSVTGIGCSVRRVKTRWNGLNGPEFRDQVEWTRPDGTEPRIGVKAGDLSIPVKVCPCRKK